MPPVGGGDTAPSGGVMVAVGCWIVDGGAWMFDDG